MKKLKAITKRVTSNNNSYSVNNKPSNRKTSIRKGDGNNQSIQVIRGGYNVDLNLVDDSFTEVHKICLLNRSEDSLFKLLKTGVNANVVDRVAGSAPLHLSVVGNNSAFILILLSNGANIDLKDGKGKTPLMKAIEIENVEIARYLLSNNANANIADDSGDTPIFVAIRNCFIDCIRLLIQPSVNVNFNILNKSHQLPLHLIANTGGLNEFLSVVIDKTVNVDIQDASKMTPLILACTCGNKEAVSLLLARKADLGITDSQGRMAHEVAKANSFPNIASLIEKHMDTEKTSQVTQRTNNQIKQAILMDWMDSDDSSDEVTDSKTIALATARKVSITDTQKPNNSNSEHVGAGKRPSYGSVIEELNQLSQSKSNNTSVNIQPSAVRKTKVEISSRKSSQGSASLDLNLKKLEASFLTSNSDNNSINSQTSSDLEVRESDVKSATKDNITFNDQFIQRLRDVLDDEIRVNDELDDILMAETSRDERNQSFAERTVDAEGKKVEIANDSPDTASEESFVFSLLPKQLKQQQQQQQQRSLPTLAPIRSLFSDRIPQSPSDTAKSSIATATASSSNVKDSSGVSFANHFDSDSSEISDDSRRVIFDGATKNQSQVSGASSVTGPDKVTKQSNASKATRASNGATEKTDKQKVVSSSIAEASADEGNHLSDRDSKLSTRETFDLNVRLKEAQAAYESERVSRMNLETEYGLLKKNCDSFIQDFRTALREKIEFESKLYQVESENSKLNYELQKVSSVRDELVREINILQENKMEQDKRILSLKIEKERLINEKHSLEEQINTLKDNLNRSESTNVDDDNENGNRMHQVVLENINFINELSSLKEEHLLLKNESVKCKSQLETELALRENEIKKLTVERDILVKENQLLRVKYDEMHQVTSDSFTNEMSELKVTIEQLTGKMNGNGNSANRNIDHNVQKALKETQETLAELTRQIKLVKDATHTLRDDQMQSGDTSIDPIDDRLHKLQTSIGLLEDRIIAQEIRSSPSAGHDTANDESKLIYPQLIQSLPVGRVPQSAFVRALLQSQDESHSKLIKEITAIKKDLGLFCWSVEHS